MSSVIYPNQAPISNYMFTMNIRSNTNTRLPVPLFLYISCREFQTYVPISSKSIGRASGNETRETICSFIFSVDPDQLRIPLTLLIRFLMSVYDK